MRLRKWLVPAALAVACSAVWGAPTDEVKALLEQGKASEAYTIGKKHPDQLGDPLFDFYFGVAAMDAGAPGEGVLALERYVLSYPDNRSARFQLGRGYYILGEDQRARDEFEGLRGAAKGDELVAIERYLDAIRARESRYQPTAGFYLEAGLGYDNNINSGVDNGKWMTIPGVVAQPNSVSTRERDFFQTFAMGAVGTYPVAPGLALIGAAGLDVRHYSKNRNDVLEQINYGGNGGVSYLSGKSLYKLTGYLSQQMIDDQKYLQNFGLSGEWSYQFDQFDRFSVVGQLGKQDYDDTQVFATKDKTGGKASSFANSRTANTYGMGVAWTHVFGVAFQPVLTLSANFGNEDNQRSRQDFSRDYYGARAQLSFTPAERWAASVAANYLESKYKGAYGNIATNPKRSDASSGFDAVLGYRLDKFWSARLEASWNKQESNIGLFDYDRASLAAKLRYEFN